MNEQALTNISRANAQRFEQRWLIYWASATSRGNDLVAYPATLGRQQVIERYEREHSGCNVEQLISKGGN